MFPATEAKVGWVESVIQTVALPLQGGTRHSILYPGYKLKCATVVEPEEVSHIPNPLVAGDPVIDLVVCLTAGTAAEDILREIKGGAFGRTLAVCNCSTDRTLHIYVSGRTMNPGADNPSGE